jgi:hypothetical protein
MLKTVSSITNAIGALNYKGTWNASTNSPALASGVGTKGDYYVVSVAGSTNLDGETLWGVGDWAVYNGTAWQKVEGGNTINATTVSASTSVTTPVIQATSSAGGTLKNNGGTAQMQWGSGGGSNLSLEVATNINPANAAVNISPTGTGTVTINPATASTMNNVAIGGSTPLAITGTTVTATGVATFSAGSAGAPAITTAGDTNTGIFFPAADTIAFSEGGAESMRIHTSGGVSIGNTTDPGATNLNVTGLLFAGATTSSTCHKIIEIRSQGSEILTVQNATAYTADFFEVSSEGFNGAAAAICVGKNSSTNRSINAGGTVNASGADYAEYMTKANDFTLAKGDVVGIDANGKLTNVFTDAISFVVKSTDPSYVGGDTWGNEEAIGKKPEDETLLSEWEAKLEVSRQAVDRIAFAGQVPVNVLGATAGEFIIPVNNNGAIKGEAVTSPTFEQYQTAVGKVIAIETDGRARIIVKVA